MCPSGFPRNSIGQFLPQNALQTSHCALCGVQYEVYRSNIKRGRRFCGSECSNKAGTPRPNRKHRDRRQVCTWCNREYETWHATQKACSVECRGALQSGLPRPQFVGELNPNFKHGLAKASRAIGRKIAMKVFTNFVCGLCGSSERVQVHHMNQNPSDNAVWNLAVLCQNCHQSVHRARREVYSIRSL